MDPYEHLVNRKWYRPPFQQSILDISYVRQIICTH